MVVFKKTTKASAVAPSQSQRQMIEQISAMYRTAASPPSQQQVANLPPAPIRYSDIAAERRSTNVDPMKKLIETFELFEQVLGYLPMEEILLATRTCRAFKTNIENSSRLQAKLFLASDLTIKKTALSASGTLLSGVKAEQHIATIQAAGQAEGSESGDILLYVVHPALKVARLSDRYKRMGMVKYATVLRQAKPAYLNEELSFHNPVRLSAFSLDISNLNRMFLTQPPVKKIVVHCPCNSGRSGGGVSIAARTIYREAGVAVGDVLMTARAASSGKDLDLRSVYVYVLDGFVVSPRARNVVEMAGELSLEDDPTRWVSKGKDCELQDGGFAFV